MQQIPTEGAGFLGRTSVILAIAMLCSPEAVQAVLPLPTEFDACSAWHDRVFPPNQMSSAALSVVYQDEVDGITRGRSWRGTPYQIAEKTYAHGLAFNSTKHLRVSVGQPAVRFTAEVGLENNDDTIRGEALGRGSVDFAVIVNGREVFKSPVLRRKDPAVRVNVLLGNATEFELRVGNGGDDRGWDQALWGEAAIELANGRKLRLQDIPWHSEGERNDFGCAFIYSGRKSPEFIGDWPKKASERTVAGGHVERTLIYKEPNGGLEVRVETVRFADWPAVEWTVHLTNTAATNTPIIEALQAMQGVLPAATAHESTLHWAKGAVASFDDFAPQQTVFKPGAHLRLQPQGGRSSSQVLPFFNLAGANEGVVAAIGWTGEWLAEFGCDKLGQVSLRAGMEKTHFTLHPGESVRTPRMMLLFYHGDRWRGQNLLRQFILAHHRPKVMGKPMVAPITCGNWGATSAEVHLDNIRQMSRFNLPIDYYWIDAEWFGQGSWYPNAGNWGLKKNLYPEGFKPLSTALRKEKRELMLWFEPERVFRGTTWHKEHPEWLVGPIGDNLLFNLGNPEACRFLIDFISSRVEEYGLGCYRQDFNFDPLPFWRAADAGDRQGISAIRYIEGLYAFWDGLLERHPGLIIDNCASGGRRLDLETLGRATPFWRTDGPRDPIAHQCHSYGLFAWVPLSATSQDKPGDDYEFRSSMSSALCLNWWVSGDAPAQPIPASFPFKWARETLEKYRSFRELFYGDYYPLSGYSQAPDHWMAYQLDTPGKGIVVVLRRPASPYETARFPLHSLDKDAAYTITNLDTGKEERTSGRELMDKGLETRVDQRPGSALLLYRK